MSEVGVSGLSSPSDSEAFEALLQLAGRRTLPIPPEALVRHVLALPGRWDWPVRRAGLEAVLRRLASARGQELAVVERPRRGSLGRYRLASPQAQEPLPYDVRLYSLGPIDARCDCADFLRGSLGLCKHVLAVLAGLARRPREWKAALEERPPPTSSRRPTTTSTNPSPSWPRWRAVVPLRRPNSCA